MIAVKFLNSNLPFHWAILRTTALMLFVSSVATVRAQPPSSNPSPASVTDNEESAKLGSNTSFTLVRRQSIIQCADIARDAIARADYLSALPLMERMLSEPNSFLPLGPSSEISSHEEVRRFMRQLPAGMRQRLEEQRAALSLRTWEKACTGGLVEVTEFVQQFGDLPLGIDAWWWIGCHERDHGRTRMAASAFMRMALHPHANNQQRAIALVAGAESLLGSVHSTEAGSFLKRLMELDSKLVIGLGGRTLSLGQWLAENRATTAIVDRGERTQQPTTIVEDRLRRPISQPTWKQNITMRLVASLNAKEQQQRDQGVRPIPIFRPLIVGDQVIVRTLKSMQSFNLSTGKDRWSIPNVEYHQIDQLRLFDNANYQSATTAWVQRRTEADSIFSRMSTDGHRLFAVQEPDRGREFMMEREVPRTLHRNGPYFNKLCAYSLESGALDWEIGGPATGASDIFGGCFFCGCPLVVDDVLFAVSQRETQVQLQAIDPAAGSLKWSLELGSVPLPIVEDFQRSRVACTIVWHDGLLLCSTSAGIIVAVDPLLRTMKWGYRYQATTISAADLIQGQNPSNVRRDQEPWWNMWREPFAMVAQQKTPAAAGTSDQANAILTDKSLLVFTSPESNSLHAICLPDGEKAWQIPRAGGLIVAGIVDQLVIVIEGDFVRAHDLATGEQRWRTMTGEVSGNSASVGSVLVLPARSGGTILLNVQTGQLLSDSSGVGAPLGSLTEAGSGWIACSHQSIMRLPKLGDVRKGVDDQLSREPESESLRIQAAFLDLQAGDTVSARGRLDGLQSSPAREIRRQALIEALREPDGNRTEADRSDLARQLKELAEDVDYKFAAGAAIGTSSLAAADLVTAVDAALDGLTSDLDQPEALVKSSSVIARKDRVLLGLIEEAYRCAKPSDLPAMDDLFLSRVKDARKSRDRFAVQRLAQQWRGLDWSRQLVVQEDERVFRKRSSVEIEFRLLDAAGATDASVAIQALEKLAQRFDRPGTLLESREVRRRILREFPDTKFDDGTNESERIARDARLRDVVFGKLKSEWPVAEPVVEPLDDRNFGVYFIIPMHAEPGSQAEGLDVIVDRNGTEVLFRGGSFYQYGQDDARERKLPLPATSSHFRQTGYMLREAWGIGRIVILMVGTELFAIKPFDDSGEPNPKFLWSNPIELQSSASDARMIAGRPGVDEPRQIVVDQTNRPIGRIGPVRAGYLCYQKGTKLVAVETETGHELWERLDLPNDATVLGDDHRIFIWRESEVVEVLSAIDGRKIEERVWRQSPATMIHNRGTSVWTVFRDKDVRTELHDLITGQSVWSRTDSLSSQVAALDTETLAVVTPDDHLHLLAARTGTPLCDPIAVDSKNMSGIVTWKDLQRWYIAVAHATGDLSKLRANQPNDSYRLRYLSGKLYAVDRDDLKVQWYRDLLDEPISLDQSVVAPVMVQVWKLVPKNDKSPLEGILRLVDKRTGKMLVDPRQRHADLQSPHFLLNPDPQQGIVELKLAWKTIRLSYASDLPADAVEAIQKANENRQSE